MPPPSRRLCRFLVLLVALFGAASSLPAQAQAAGSDPAARSVSPYLYMIDSEGNKVLLATNFWRNDAKYDERALGRFGDVMSGLEKRGFRKSADATIDSWDRPEPVVRCYIYMEDLQSAGSGRGGKLVTGSRVWCSDNGASERDIRGSDNPKHVAEVLKYFDVYFKRAKANLQK